MGRKTCLIGSAVVVAVVAGAAIWFTLPRSTTTDGETTTAAGRLVRRIAPAEKKDPAAAVREAMQGMETSGKIRNRRPLTGHPADMFAGLSGADRTLAEAVFAALETGELAATLEVAAKALASSNPEVRSHGIEALSWFGSDALPELTGAMADPDEEVSEAAENAWEVALAEVGDPARRFAIAAAALGSLSNADHLGAIAGHLSGAALEMVDSEDDEAKANDKRITVVQTLVDLIEADETASAEAKEAYEDITGNEWRSFEEAELYVSDPENYELPEDREDADADDDADDSDSADDSGVEEDGSGDADSDASADEDDRSGSRSSGTGTTSDDADAASTGFDDGAGTDDDGAPEDGEIEGDMDSEDFGDDSAEDADGEMDGDAAPGETEPAEEDGPPAPVLVK